VKIDLPGIVYSLLLAVGAWAVEYFTSGPGTGVPWAPIMVATVPILLKSFTVTAGNTETATISTSSTRSIGPYEETVVVQPRSKIQKLLLG